jgi:hypothetical protein
LINQFDFGVKGIEGLLGDREFASGQLFKWLKKKKIPFYIRIKATSKHWPKILKNVKPFVLAAILMQKN